MQNLGYRSLRGEGKCLYFSPMGYLDHGSDNKVFDPERAPLVKRIFELYSTGEWSFNQLGKWACDQGLTTKPMRRHRTREEILNNIEKGTLPKTSRPATHKTIEYILSNPFYIGKVKFGSGFVDGTHQPLIDLGLFNKVQGILKKRCVSVHYMDKEFFHYRGALQCACGRGYSPYKQKGITYYRVRCKADCTNPDKNLTESKVHILIQKTLSEVHYTEEEIMEIERRAKSELGVISQKRDKALDDLHAQRKKVFADLDYLIMNKLMLLRTNTMSISDVNADEARFNAQMSEIDAQIAIYIESAKEMLRYVITFSELVKNAALYYEHALDEEKRELATQVFSELIFCDGKLVKSTAKEGFDALLSRDWLLGGPTRNRTPTASFGEKSSTTKL